MDLELTDEQTWLSESLTTLLEREWPRRGDGARRAAPERARAAVGARSWSSARCVDGRGPRRRRAVPRGAALGAHLASTPFLGSAALRYARRRTSATTGVVVALWSPVAAGRWTTCARPSGSAA